MKQILIYFNSMGPAGGIERVISNLANKWTSNFQVTVLTKDNQPYFYPLNKKVSTKSLNLDFNLDMTNRIHRIIQTWKSYISSVQKLKVFLKDYSFDYIYVATPLNAMEVYMTHTVDVSKKLVISEHASYYGYNKIFNRIKKFIYPKAYKIVAPTSMDTAIYEKKGYRTIYIPHLTTFLAEEKVNSLDTKLAITVGRLTSDKRQLLLLNMWKEMEGKIRKENWKLIIVGKGEEMDNLKNYIKVNEINDIVKIIPPRKNISEIYKKASLFVFTSRYEGFGMVLLEAMAFGIPCISYDVPSGPRDIVVNEFNGYLIPDQDCTGFEQHLKKYIDLTVVDKQILGRHASDTVKNWDNDSILRTWNTVFKN